MIFDAFPDLLLRPLSRRLLAAAAAVALTGASAHAFAEPPAADRVARGRYLVQIAGCNDCHTAGYAQRDGDVPESDWLTGLPVGFKGPWGTTYAANLRIALGAMTEAQWMKVARTRRMPPMPWFALRDMSDEDLGAIYRYVRALGVSGSKMPLAVPPGTEPTTPYLNWVPQLPGGSGSIAGAGGSAATH